MKEQSEEWITLLYIKVNIDGRLLLKERIGNQRREHIHAEVEHTAMSGVNELRYVFQFVVDGLYYRALPQHQLVIKRHQLVFHVASEPSNQVQTIAEQMVKQSL